jgi:competence protein ComEC
MREPPVGEKVMLGDLAIEVLGPLRRYASPNDQSIVLGVTGPTGRTLLLTGDIETFAQADLRGVTADILKVPHQGGATSNLEWLEEVDAGLAVISVGPNDFGHPSDEVIAVLEASGAEVRRTDIDGDIVVPLD